ncbi:MAG: hypothetical protein ABMA64_36750, partial [Myxococcota bacterium]
MSLWTRAHEDGSVTVRVLGDDDLTSWGPLPEPLVEELELAMSDRIERSHPRLLERLATAPPAEVSTIEVPDALIVFGERGADGELPRLPTRFHLAATTRGEWRELWIPRLEARAWLPIDAEVAPAAIALVTELLADRSALDRLPLRYTGPETLTTRTIAATPAPLGRFTEPGGPRDLLPEPVAPDEPEERRPDGTKTPHTPTL